MKISHIVMFHFFKHLVTWLFSLLLHNETVILLFFLGVAVYLFFTFFFELQLVYLPDRKREYFIDDDDVSLDSELSLEGKLDLNNPDESARFDRRSRKRGMLGWFKLKVFLLYNGLWIS